MSIALYRKGSTHIVRGIECEIGTFNASQLQEKLKEGWHTDPKDLKSDVLEAIREQNEKGNDIKTEAEIIKPKKGKKGKK